MTDKREALQEAIRVFEDANCPDGCDEFEGGMSWYEERNAAISKMRVALSEATPTGPWKAHKWAKFKTHRGPWAEKWWAVSNDGIPIDASFPEREAEAVADALNRVASSP